MFRLGGKYLDAFFMGTLLLGRRRAREEVGGFVLFLLPTLSALLHLLGEAICDLHEGGTHDG